MRVPKILRARAGLAGPRVLEKGRGEVASSSSSSSGSDTDCDAACDEEAAGAGARRQNRRVHAACPSASYSNASCNVRDSGSLALCSLELLINGATWL